MADTQGIRQLFTGATLRHVIGLPTTMADNVLAFAGQPGRATTMVAANKRDVWVNSVDYIGNVPHTSRLHVPCDALWRLPPDGADAMILKPSHADGPGVSYFLFGTAGGANQVPFWLSSTDAGLQVPETLHLESTQRAVTIQSNVNGATQASITLNKDGSIDINVGLQSVRINNGSLAVARLTDPVTGMAGPYPLANGQIAGGSAHLSA